LLSINRPSGKRNANGTAIIAAAAVVELLSLLSLPETVALVLVDVVIAVVDLVVVDFVGVVDDGKNLVLLDARVTDTAAVAAIWNAAASSASSSSPSTSITSWNRRSFGRDMIALFSVSVFTGLDNG
jgi:hypothetical protein